jgi:hypothetical protein
MGSLLRTQLMQPIDLQPNQSSNPHKETGSAAFLSEKHTLSYNNRQLSAEDFKDVEKYITAISLDRCTSLEWQKVLSNLVDISQVTELCITDCGLSVKVLWQLTKMVQLQRLVLGMLLLI